jgi:hypothetical protein
MTPSEREEGQLERHVVTVYEKTWVRGAGTVTASDSSQFVIPFPGLVWSDSLRADALRLTEGCLGASPTGTYTFDKGLQTGDFDRVLEADNDYLSEFVHSPVTLVGDWVVSAGDDANCGNKPNETVKAEFRAYCPTN